MTRLLLVSDAVGGVWTYSLDLATALRPLGVETVLLVVGPSPTTEQKNEASDFALIDSGLPLEWLDTSPREIRRAAQTIADVAQREGADVVQVSSATLLADVSFTQPTVAVQHSCVASWWAATRATPLPPEFAWRRDLAKAGLRRASSVVAPSSAFAAETSRLYDVPVLTVHNGRGTGPSIETSQHDFVLTACRLWDDGKNAATLDQAAAKLDVPFQAAGAVTGPNGATARLDHLQLLGELRPERLRSLLAARPVFASAAVYEPFGLSVLEAAQAGCALILSDIPTHREIWADAATFVPAREPEAFVGAIRRIMSDPAERLRLGDRARSQSKLYRPAGMARGMADIYARLTAPAALAGAA